MRYVSQEDEFGCGVACVANRLNVSYQTALSLFDEPAAAKSVGYACKVIVNVLRKSGIDVRLRHISIKKPEPTYQNGDIVFLLRSKRFPFQHYLMKCPDGWIDPWINMNHNKDIAKAKVGIRKKLPGRPYYRITVS